MLDEDIELVTDVVRQCVVVSERLVEWQADTVTDDVELTDEDGDIE